MALTIDLENAFYGNIIFITFCFIKIKCSFELEDFCVVKVGPRVIKTGIAVTLALYI